jgi:hypothetical protein
MMRKTFGNNSRTRHNGYTALPLGMLFALLALLLTSCSGVAGPSPRSTTGIHSPSSAPTTVPTPASTPGPVMTPEVPFSSAFPSTAPLVCPNQGHSSTAGQFIKTDGIHFLVAGAALKLAGFTFYPALLGGAAAWHSTQFPAYIDRVITTGAQAGQNLIRTTDFWDSHDQHNPRYGQTIWHNVDYLVCDAAAHSMYVELDVSAFEWFLTSQHANPYDTANWINYLEAIGDHYSNQPNIAFYSILGEPPIPTTVAAMQRLVSFYRDLTDTLYQADGGHHLISAGGFNHMGEETPQIPWWQQIYALPHNDVAAFKTYSQKDLNLIPTIASYAHQIGKPPLDEEFGMTQASGDGTYTGIAYEGIETSRADFYQNVYSIGNANGIQGFVFWNLGCQMNDTSYDVSPQTPAVWQVVQDFAPDPLTGPNTTDSLC